MTIPKAAMASATVRPRKERHTGMGSDPQGVLAIWHDILPGHVADVLAWYDAEHHFERLGVPGFLSVRRYHALDAAPQLFIRYETASPDVLASSAYLERLNNPTPWTLRSQPCFRNNSRTVCVRAARAGRAEGGVAVTARFMAANGDAPVPPSLWPDLVTGLLGTSCLPGAPAAEPAGGRAGIAGVVGLELWRADREASAIPTAEKRLRGGEDLHVAATLVVHATDKAAADDAARLLPSLLRDRAEAVSLGVYALAFSASNFSI